MGAAKELWERTQKRKAEGKIPDYSKGQSQSVKVAATRSRPIECTRRGLTVIETVPCLSCGGRKTELKVYPCEIHGKCTIGRKVQDIQCCVGCGDVATPTPQ